VLNAGEDVGITVEFSSSDVVAPLDDVFATLGEEEDVLVGKLGVVLDDMLPEVIVELVLRSKEWDVLVTRESDASFVLRTDPSVLSALTAQTSSLSQQQSPVWSQRVSHQQSWSDPPPHLPIQLPALLHTDKVSFELCSGPSVLTTGSTAVLDHTEVVLDEVEFGELLLEVEDVLDGILCNVVTTSGRLPSLVGSVGVD